MVLWNRLLHRLRRARDLSRSDWLAFFEAWWRLLGFNLAIRWVSFDRLNRAAGNLPGKKATGTPTAERLHWLIVLASRHHIVRMTCLVQALTFRRMLAGRGLAAQIRIGAVKSPSGLSAHAWVEMDGAPVGEFVDVAERFKVLRSG